MTPRSIFYKILPLGTRRRKFARLVDQLVKVFWQTFVLRPVRFFSQSIYWNIPFSNFNSRWRSFPIIPRPTPVQLKAVFRKRKPEKEWKKDIFCFSIIDWNYRYQRPQQMMAQAARAGHRVFYLSLSRFLPPTAVPRAEVRELLPNLFEVSLAADRSPAIYTENIAGKEREAILASLEDLRRGYKIDDAVGYVMLPSWNGVATAARDRWGWQIIYDCMDEWDGFPGIDRGLIETEKELVRSCDLLVVTAQKLFDKWKTVKPQMVLARNAADTPFFLRECRSNSLLNLKPPIVGYFGAIAEWFDIELMTEVARQRPDYNFVLVGQIFGVDVSCLRSFPNVHLLGNKAYGTIPRYLYHFDACLIPFRINPITEATDPVKLYEYFTAGKPVVATPMSELGVYRDCLYTGATAEEFASQLDLALRENNPDLIERRKKLARENTWEDRWGRIQLALSSNTPKVSIIIVTYNNLPLTHLCLQSVLRNTRHCNYEVIVVDNHSSDGTPAYLQRLDREHVRVILNTENRGFAAANNQGLEIAGGTHLVLLNNDTIVPPDWLTHLIRHLDDPTVGLVGPVSNFVGNEAKIAVTYRTLEEMESFARQREELFRRRSTEIEMLAMFCLAFSREVFSRLGPLDERFRIGMFEDDDYSERAKQAGYRTVCALDTFVHHFGESSFSRLGRPAYLALFQENRERFEEKWKRPWVANRGPKPAQ